MLGPYRQLVLTSAQMVGRALLTGGAGGGRVTITGAGRLVGELTIVGSTGIAVGDGSTGIAVGVGGTAVGVTGEEAKLAADWVAST
jgi:hypothetical protein